MSDPEAREDRILTIPNVITVVRLGLLPVFLWLLFSQDDRVGAAIVLGVIGATDFLDGYIARHFDQVSNVGKVLDPVADRVLFFVSGVAIIIDGSIPLWVAWLVLIREVLVSLATVGLALAGAKRIDVTWFGKAGTFCVMCAFPLFLASEGNLFWADFARSAAWCFTIPGLVFGYIALVMYVPIGLRALREGRAARSDESVEPPDGRAAPAR